MRTAVGSLDTPTPLNRIRQLRWAVASLTFAAIAVALVNMKHLYLASNWKGFAVEAIKLLVLCIAVKMAWATEEDRHTTLRVAVMAACISLLTDPTFLR